MPVVVAIITPRPECRLEVLAALQRSLPAVHHEPGCQLYALHEAEESFVIVEQWESATALEQHNGGDAVREVVSEIGEKLMRQVQIVQGWPVPGGDQRKGRLVPPSAADLK